VHCVAHLQLVLWILYYCSSADCHTNVLLLLALSFVWFNTNSPKKGSWRLLQKCCMA